MNRERDSKGIFIISNIPTTLYFCSMVRTPSSTNTFVGRNIKGSTGRVPYTRIEHPSTDPTIEVTIAGNTSLGNGNRILHMHRAQRDISSNVCFVQNRL